MSKLKKQPRPKAETPKGFRDYFGYELIQRQKLLNDISEVYQLYGFSALESSAVETVEALGKFLPDIDRPNEGVFAWEEDDTWLALRYDLTAPLARVYSQFRNDLPNPYRRYSMGPVWRNEKPGLGRYRQFYQCDADTVGSSNLAADVEICTLLCDALEAAGISRGDYIVKVNNRKILNGVMEVAGLLKPDDVDYKINERSTVLRAIDKLDRLGVRNISELLGRGRKDDSGDFTKGANLSEEQIKIITKDTSRGFIPFKFNECQKQITEALDEQYKYTGRVRAIILKARQQGISTYCAGRVFWKSYFSPHSRSVVMAHDSATSDALFSMSKNLIRNMEGD